MRNVFLHSIFFNKDFLLNTLRKSINILTVILEAIMEGRVSHFVDVSFFFLLCYVEEKSKFFSTFLYVSHDKKKKKKPESKF